MRALPTRLLAVGVALLLVGCGTSDEASTEAGVSQPEASRNEHPQPVKPRHHLHITLNGRPGPETSGILLADQRGYFADVGLKMTITYPQSPALPITYAASGATDVVVTQEPELVLARDEGFSLVAFGSLVPHPTMAMIWLKGSGIDSVADLKGKTIAYPGIRFQKDFLEAALERAGLTPGDVKIKSVSYYLESELIHHRADAIFGGSAYIEGKLLEAHGLEPVVTPARKLGIPDYDELVLITRRDRYAEDPRSFQSLTEATTRGGMTVADRPGAATKAIVHQKEYEDSARPNLPIHRKTIRAGVEEIAPRFSHTGEINRVKLQRLVDWMYARGMIKRKWQASELLAGP